MKRAKVLNKALTAVLLAITLAPQALAHEGGRHVRGTIREITAERLVITERPGKDETFTINGSTTFTRGRTAVRWDEAKVGERAVVHGAPGAHSTAAAEVMLGSARPAP